MNIGPNFAKVFGQSSNGFCKYLKGDFNYYMSLYETTFCEVVSDINKTKTKSSPGIDEINSKNY